MAEVRYRAWGEDRYTSGATPTTYRYTGQRNEADLGLYYYGARWYDPYLGRFVQADTMVPEAGNPQNLNRFSYAANNPFGYTDPTGHQPRPPVAVPDDIPEERIYTPSPEKKASPTPPGGRMYSDAEVDALAKTIYGEDRGNVGKMARIGVAWTAINRLLYPSSETGYYSDIVDVVSAPGQYAYDSNYPLTYEGLARGILEGEHPDPTYGSTYMGHYELGSKEHQAAQSWSAHFPESYHYEFILPEPGNEGPPLIVANFEYHNFVTTPLLYPPLPMDPSGFPR